MCSRDVARCAPLSPVHSLTLLLPFSSRSLARTVTHSLTHLLPRSLGTLLPPPPSPVIIVLHHRLRVCVSCRSLIALRAVCNHWKGFPASVHKVEFTDGNTIHPIPQAPPPSLAIISSFSSPPPQPVSPSSVFPPSQADKRDRSWCIQSRRAAEVTHTL